MSLILSGKQLLFLLLQFFQTPSKLPYIKILKWVLNNNNESVGTYYLPNSKIYVCIHILADIFNAR